MTNSSELHLTLKDHETAFTEVSFLLDMLVRTIETFVGKASAALAVAAGKNMAGNLPIHLNDPELATVLDELVRVLSDGLDISGTCNGDKALINLRHCPIGDVCAERKMDVGGQACEMFHFYIAGIMAALTNRPCRPATVETGKECSFELAFGRPRPQQ